MPCGAWPSRSMRLKWILATLTLMMSINAVQMTKADCACSLFLVTAEVLKPQHKVFSTGETYHVNCTNPFEAKEQCRRYCSDEVVALNDVFISQPQILEEYSPQEDVPCDTLPAHTSSFFSACGNDDWTPSYPKSQLSSSVCCHPSSGRPVWCESLAQQSLSESQSVSGKTETQDASFRSMQIDRKIDTDTDKNDVFNNEIEGSTKPLSDEDSVSWMTNVLNFFGYNSIGEMIQDVDIFSLPGKIQSAVKTYNDEISMGQCYMEFTTYSVFKHDGILTNLIRNRRDSQFSTENEERSTGPIQQSSPIQSLIDGLVGMLEGSPTTRQYADIIRQLVPVVMQMYTSDDPTSAITSFMTQAIGPFLSQMGSSSVGSPSDNSVESFHPGRRPIATPAPVPKTTPPPRQRPPQGGAGSSGSSPITSLILQLVKYYLSAPDDYPVQEITRPTIPPTRAPVSHRPPPALSAASSSSIANILGLLFGSGQSQSQVKPKPPVVKKPTKPQILEKVDKKKSFVEMVLEFIRPVFISIIGKAPGENGVASIREVTRLSSLGRVDDTLVEEVLSPYFCLKNYVVNKAWTLTERGVSSVVARFTPEEKARMMRMMQDDEITDFNEWEYLK